MDLKEQFKLICNEYMFRFAKKQGISWDKFDETNCWVADAPGTIACVNDCFFDFEDIRYDVDNNIEQEKIFKWYYNYIEREQLGLRYMNYPSFCKGAPDPIPAEKLAEIQELRKQVTEAKAKLFASIDQYSNGNKPIEELF